MPYREFHYEKHYDAPNTDQAYATQVQGITNLFRNLQQKQEQRRKASDQFAYDLDQGAFENDTKMLTEVAKNVTARAKQELRTTGKLSLETENLMKSGTGWQQMSKNQMERAKQLNADIKSKADPYYNPEPDLNLVKWAAHGEDNDVDLRTRGERLDQAEKKLGGIDTFRYDKYRADYVKSLGPQWKDVESPLKSGASKTIRNEATFWDTDRGVPGVTDKHAIRYLESDHRVAEYFDQKVSNELRDEVKRMKSSGDERTAWMKDKSESEIINELINDPSKNLINNQEYGTRVREQAKADLTEADRINTKVSYTALPGDKNGSGGRWSNPNILHDNTIVGMAQEAKAADGGMESISTYGPGGRFTQKSGRPITIDTTNPVRTDTDKGLTVRNSKGNLRLNMTGYQLMPVRKGMAPFALKSKTAEGMIQEIENIPLEHFDPAGKIALQPEMRIGLNGYTVNEAGVLNDVQDQLYNISAQIAEATKSGDKEKLGNLQNLEYNLQELKDMIGSGDYDEQDLIMAGNKAGVRKIQNNLIIPADPSDLSTIKNVTGGFDLRDKSFWSPEMLAVETAYKKRADEAKAQGYGVKKEEPKAKTSIPTVTNDADYAKLPSGSEYIAPDGVKRRKK